MPVRLDRYIEVMLYGSSGYYSSTADTRKDFCTAPESYPEFNRFVAFLFELIAKKNKLESFQVVDLGSGQGDLIAAVERLLPQAKPVAVEISPVRRKLIAEKTSRTLVVEKIEKVDTNIPTLIIANEFFDALPVRALKKQDNSVLECFVDNNQPIFKKSDDEFPALVAELLQSLPEGFVVEFEPYTFELVRKLKYFPAVYLLIIDYGFTAGEMQNFPQGTLTGYLKHTFLNEPLRESVPIDITHHVNFELLRTIFAENGFETEEPVSLGNFIVSAYQKHSRLIQADLQKMKNLVLPGKMGDVFKVLTAARGLELNSL